MDDFATIVSNCSLILQLMQRGHEGATSVFNPWFPLWGFSKTMDEFLHPGYDSRDFFGAQRDFARSEQFRNQAKKGLHVRGTTANLRGQEQRKWFKNCEKGHQDFSEVGPHFCHKSTIRAPGPSRIVICICTMVNEIVVNHGMSS